MTTDPGAPPAPSVERSTTPCPETLEELGATYDANYYQTGCGPFPYNRTEPHWTHFFGGIATRLIEVLKPRRVLDAGCALGFLVEAFWDRGVEAWGIDISPFAIENVRRDMRDYCRVGSISQDIEGTYDLITCIEVLEHMRESDAQDAIRAMCNATDTILFSSTPTDFKEPTHFNIRPLLYWMTSFQQHGFAPDLGFDATFVTGHAMLFRRSPTWPLDVLQSFVALMQTRMALTEARQQIVAKDQQISQAIPEKERATARISDLESVRATVDAQEETTAALRDEIAQLRDQNAASQDRIFELTRLLTDITQEVRTVEISTEELNRHLLATPQVSGKDIDSLTAKVSDLQREVAALAATQRSMLNSRIWRSLVGASGLFLRVKPPFGPKAD